MDQNQKTWNEKAAAVIIDNLKKRHMEGSYAPDAAQAREEVLAMIPEGAVVYRCASMTTAGIGLWDRMAEMPGVQIIDHYRPGLSPEESMNLRRQGLLADVMIASANAITLDGVLVNLDAVGNRVAAMTFGPKKVILVAGMNKVVPDLATAKTRVKHYAATVNTLRAGYKNPCVETGLCSDCRSPQRICNVWAITEGQLAVNEGRIHVKLVGENLGY
ncbi:MAG: lactate utilization protein [Syntrophotaleaceae bacterium]